MDPTLIQLLLPYLAGMSNSDASATLGVQAKGTNNMQDILSLLLDPQFGMMSNTYDPMLTVPQQQVSESLPITDHYANSGIPVIQEVALGLKSGQYVPEQAQAILTAAINDGTLSGWDPEQTNATVLSMFEEITAKKAEFDQANTAANAPKDNVYSQAGLPQPTEMYQAGFGQDGQFLNNAPISQTLSKQMSDNSMALNGANDYLARYQQENPEYRNAEGRASAASDVGTLTSASDRALASRTDKMTVRMPESLAEAKSMGERLGQGDQYAKWYEQAWQSTLKGKQTGSASRLSPTEKAALESTFNRLMKSYSTSSGKTKNAVLAWDQNLGKQVNPTKADVAQAEIAASWSGRGAQYAKQIAGQKVSAGAKSFEQQKSKSTAGLREAQIRQMADADFMTSQGQTPLTSALQQRVAMLRAAGLL